MSSTELTRRAVLGVVGGGACAALTGCGGDGEAAPAGPAAGTDLVATGDVPVGSGVVLPDLEVVVTQPTEGSFLAFSSICTHQGCPVDTVSGDEILCPCHGSVFSTTDGSVVEGPASEPLPSYDVEVAGGQVVTT